MSDKLSKFLSALGQVEGVAHVVGKAAPAVRMALNRAQDGVCVRCGEEPIGEGFYAKLRMCEECGKDSTSAVLGVLFKGSGS